MSGIHYLALAVAALAAVVAGAVWYGLLFATAYMKATGMSPGPVANRRPPVGAIFADFVRYLVFAYALGALLRIFEVADWKGAVYLAVWVWLGFQATMLLGAVIHEKMPWKLYAIHAGDALVKTLVMTLILGVWR